MATGAKTAKGFELLEGNPVEWLRNFSGEPFQRKGIKAAGFLFSFTR